MSSNKQKIFSKRFDTYADVVSFVLKERQLKQIWLVRQILKEDQSESSLQQQMSRWLRESAPISEGYQHRINNALNIVVRKEHDGKWVILQDPQSRDEQELYQAYEQGIDSVDEPSLDALPQLIRLRDKLDEKIRKLTQRKDRND